MSVYWVATWSVRPDAIAEHDEEALPALLKHVREEHPRVLSVRTWAVRWGAEPARPGRVWMEEFASLTSIDEVDAVEHTSACKEVWDRVHALIVPGTFRTVLWNDPLRKDWKEPA